MSNSNSQAPTTIASYAGAIAKALEYRGVDANAVLKEAGVQHLLGSDPMERLPIDTVSRLFKLSVKATNDPCFGLTVAKFMHPSTLHALGYSLLASSTVRDFCERVSRYFRLASQSGIMDLEQQAGQCRFVLSQLAAGVCVETQDAWIAFLVHFIRLLHRPDFNPLRVELIRPVPAPGPQPFEEFFKAPVSFGHAEVAIYIDPDEMDIPLQGASTEIAQHNDKIVIDYMAKLDRADIVSQVKSTVIDLLATGNISKQLVADKLHVAPRTLQLKLSQRDTSFQELLDETRRSLACGYIEQRGLSVTEITYLLGFSDTSNFTRAFKRWTGLSPSVYRSQTFS